MRVLSCGALLLAVACLGAKTVSAADTAGGGRLDQMLAGADLVFKGQVLSSVPVTNNAFRVTSMGLQATRMKVISVLQGKAPGDEIVFDHYAYALTGPWGGPPPPAYYRLEPGQTCLVFAAKLDRPDTFYAPPPGGSNRPAEFRQIADSPSHFEDGLTRTLDARPLTGLAVKAAVWQELNLLLPDSDPANALYAIDRLDAFSLSQGKHAEACGRTDDFQRGAVLDALLPLLTNPAERVANRAIDCFAADAGSPVLKAEYVRPLSKLAVEAPSSWTRYFALKALSGGNGGALTNALARLLQDPDENVRLCAVTLLPGFPRDFAEAALRQRATDESPGVRSVVADVIGEGQYAGDLPVLAALFAGSTSIPSSQQRALPREALNPRVSGNGMGDVHGDAGAALTRFDADQVAGILKSNLNDADFHVAFIAKLGEKDAGPWLTELTNLVAKRVIYADDVARSDPLDPRRFSDPTSTWTLTGAWLSCWEDVRHYLAALPPQKLAGSEMAPCLDLLADAIQTNLSISSPPAHEAYELFQTRGLAARAASIRRRFPADKWWFDDFDRQHAELNAAR
jgi:hypothetical protein